MAGSCSFGGGSRPGGVTTTNTRVNGPATFDTDFNGSVDTSHVSNCQQDGSCRFQGKRSAPDDLIIPLLKKVTQKRSIEAPQAWKYSDSKLDCSKNWYSL